MYTIDEIKKEAELNSLAIDINWDKLEDPQELEYFKSRLTKGMEMLPDLESLYKKLTSGKSVVFPEAESPLEFDEQEHYTELVAEELFAAYMLQSVYDRFQKVNSIIELSGSKG